MSIAADQPAPSPVATIAGLPLAPHDHLCVLYRGAPQRDELMVDFLSEGMDAGHKCYCLIADTENDRVASAVSGRGTEAVVGAAAPDDGTEDLLEFIAPNGSYLRPGGFASEQMLSFWEGWACAAFGKGQERFVRIGADMSWASPLVAPEFIADLTRYEARFNLWSSRHPQVTACMYDMDRFGGEVVVPMIKVHPKIWMDGLVLENPYYLQTEDILRDEVESLTGSRIA